MAWIYLAESEESQSLLAIGSDLSHTAKLTHTVKEFCSPEWLMGGLIPHQSGLISKHLWPRTLQAAVISSQADFPARISVLQGLEKAWQESEADYFSRSCAFPKKSSPSSYSLKMCQLSLLEEEAPWLKRLPKWGMIVGGVLYPLRALEHYTAEKGGSCWPTPTRNANLDCPSERARKTPALASAVMMATPRMNATRPVHTPCHSVIQKKHGETLPESVGRLYPENIGKRLCPKWTSVLMGYQTTWTDLEHWAMQYVLSKRKKRSKS